MSNNARVVDGGEIGSAQYFQALAAGAEPDVRMNPVLLKPEADTRSQVVVLGVATPTLSGAAVARAQRALWPVVAESLRALRDDNEVVVIEGAGSPAEINLAGSDIPTCASAQAADARVPAGDRHRPRRRLRPPLRHLGAARAGDSARGSAASCSTSSAATRRCSRRRRSSCRS